MFQNALDQSKVHKTAKTILWPDAALKTSVGSGIDTIGREICTSVH